MNSSKSSYDEYPECPECEGRGYLIHGPEPVQQGEPCHVCKGKGHIETPSPLGEPSFPPAVLANAEQSPTPADGTTRPAKAMRCKEKPRESATPPAFSAILRQIDERGPDPYCGFEEVLCQLLRLALDRERLANMRATEWEEAEADTADRLEVCGKMLEGVAEVRDELKAEIALLRSATAPQTIRDALAAIRWLVSEDWPDDYDAWPSEHEAIIKAATDKTASDKGQG